VQPPRAIHPIAQITYLPAVIAGFLVIFAGLLTAQDAYRSPEELEKLSVEELEDIDITSVSKHPCGRRPKPKVTFD
jgi:hypothetical protein